MASTASQVEDGSAIRNVLQQFTSWYSNIPSIRMDIHGDFAGSELFLVEGDTLVRHALTSTATEGAAVDMEDGWQILHAVATVESFLANLKKRGCRFEVVFFDSHKQLSVPSQPISNSRNRYKYLVARESILQHLLSNSESKHLEKAVYTFDNPTDGEFDKFLDRQRPYFIMCHDHGVSPPPVSAPLAIDGAGPKPDQVNGATPETSEDAEKTVILSFIWHVMDLGYTVGLTNEVEFLDSKVFTHIVAPWEIEQNRPLFRNITSSIPALAEPRPRASSDSKSLLTAESIKGLTAGEALTILGLRNLWLSADGHKDIVAKFGVRYLLHTALLTDLSLAQRHLPSISFPEGETEIAEFLQVLGGEFLELLRDKEITSELRKRKSDFGDFIDGRLFRNVVASSASVSLLELLEQCSEQSREHYKALRSAVLDVTAQQFPLLEDKLDLQVIFFDLPPQPKPDNLPVLPFSNPAFEQYIKNVNLPTESTSPSQTRYEKALYETSISGAAMRKLKRGKMGPTENYRPSEKKKWWQLRGEQIYQADMLKYALSLSGTGGVGLAPERIITASPSDRKKIEPAPTQSASDKKEVTGKNKNLKTNPKAGAKISKAAEIKAANAALMAAKAGKKAPDVWKQFYTAEVASCKTDRARVMVLTNFIQKSADENSTVEARLFKCSYLFNIWRDEYCSAAERAKEGYEIVALLFSEATKIATSSGLTKQIKEHIDGLFVALGFSPLSVPEGAPALSSKPLTVTPPPVPTGTAASKTKVGMSSLEFQLQFCGPYMDRNLDSSKDDRVRFSPDRWQVNVLDALDADKSVFVVAPTSAGKTFIAYYAMEKILRHSDDDVLVYVAPTKALVNQIAAELQARFVKEYPKQIGKTVWAIHTGDYSINNPQKCQVLVTVPHILQIMLLSPAHATTWTPRVKRIILDEVHCIGQSEDGAVWEQLLVLAPCPIIALSATVGNPGEFHQWLQLTQAGLQWKGSENRDKSKGVEVVMIHHKHRYNNLRTFYYKGLPDQEQKPFEGLEQPKVYSLGLADLESSKSFKHLHPVVALGDDSGSGVPEDLSLESRDCYALYKVMEKVQTKEHPLPAKLAPGKAWFPEVVRKADVIVWESELKRVLKDWMVNAKPQFLEVVTLLRGEDASPEKIEGQSGKAQKQETGDGGKTENEQEEPEESNQLALTGEQLSHTEERAINETLDLLSKLHSMNALPALLFSYDRSMCDTLCLRLVKQLVEYEKRWRENSMEWKKKVAEKELYLKRKEEADRKSGKVKKVVKKKGGDDEHDDMKEQKDMDSRGDDASAAIASFDPEAPSEQFSFAGRRNISKEDLEVDLAKLKRAEVGGDFIEGLRRGVGVHHAGLSRPLRECVERLFRKGYLRVVIATGTLSLGINMPCATVVFVTDNVHLTPLNFRQAAGRAGRRGFDLLGNVIFHGLPLERIRRLINSNLPSLMGHFPTSTTLILRLLTLLHGSNNAPSAISTVNSLLSQTRISLGSSGTDFGDQVIHHIRFSIEYLRRMNLLSSTGEPTNFAALTAHLYYTEPSNFLFNVLMREGVFHSICAPLSVPSKENVDPEALTLEVNRKLLIILAHIFGRVPFRKSDNVELWRANSKSTVLLPDLPQDAAEVMRKHNQESLKVFSKYVVTYAARNKAGRGEDTLPYSEEAFGGKTELPTPQFLKPLKPVYARSPFVALSGYSDAFTSIPELGSTCRNDILLEASGLPYLAVDGVRLNAYIYDFLQHGNVSELVVANHLQKGEIWYMLNDFSIVLATIVTTLKNLVSVGPEGEMRMGDIAVGRGVGEDILEEVVAAAETDVGGNVATPSSTKLPIGRKKPKASWDDVDASDVGTSSNLGPDGDEEEDEGEEIFGDGEGDTDRQALLKVLKGFVNLQQEFNDKFRATFATKKDAQRARKKLLDAQKAANPTLVKEKKPRLKLR
ncbi:hypothetical protein EV426DRAFT_561732 [Tirmania nivea]|nr:hypothetical protein EV426DRAFT_561732 [Tirmania nivea]